MNVLKCLLVAACGTVLLAPAASYGAEKNAAGFISYGSHDELRQHLQLFIDAYNHGRRLKTLRGLTPYEYVARIWTEDPVRFKIDPYRHITGPNT